VYTTYKSNNVLKCVLFDGTTFIESPINHAILLKSSQKYNLFFIRND
jgi:hypothetical protein